MSDAEESWTKASPLAICSVTAIVLAAGLSTRLKSRGTKLLCQWKGRPLILHTVENILASPVSRVIVVVGHEGQKIIQVLADQSVEFTGNDRPADGMSGSLIAGLERMSEEGECADGVMVCLGDMPLIKPSTISCLVRQFSAAQKPCICRPVYKGAAGHPVIFSAALLDDLSGIQGDQGAKNTVEANRHLVNYLLVDDQGVLFDVDTEHSLNELMGIRT